MKEFWLLISNIGIIDIVDILTVAYLAYRVLLTLRSTSSYRILKAVGLVLVLSWVTGLIQMHALHYMLSQFLQIGIVALVVLFQPELRRVLDRLGGKSLRELLAQRSEVGEVDRVINQTVAACEAMAREKVGALIAFERKTQLDDYFKNGTIIDAVASEQLYRNIFFNKAPLHDGALIVRGNRLAAAGCVLPLSNNHQLSADLGTRHRAGVGLSEVSDAVVVIVSEETGTISVAVNGMLKRHLAPKTLSQLLNRELKTETTEQKNIGQIGQRLLQSLQKKEDKNGEE